jgi:hypothetical protein
MTTDEDEARWKRKLAAAKALATEADDLFVWLCEIEGGEAVQECTAARAEVFAWVARHPRHSAAARQRVMTETD